MVAFQIAAGHIVKEEIGTAIGMKSLKEFLLDAGLVFGQPSQVGIKLIFIEGLQFQYVASGVTAGQADGAQARAWLDGARQHLPQGQFSLAVRAQNLSEADALGQLMEGPDGAKGKTLAQVERTWVGGPE
jgi:hypothetical protein